MKTVNLIITLALVLTGAFVNAQDAQPAEPTAPSGGFVSLEVVDANGIPLRDEVIIPRFPDENMIRAACCVQPEEGKFQKSAIISMIESLAIRHTFPLLVVESGKWIDACNKVAFITALNKTGLFEEIKKLYPAGVVLQIRKETIHPSAVGCLLR